MDRFGYEISKMSNLNGHIKNKGSFKGSVTNYSTVEHLGRNVYNPYDIEHFNYLEDFPY
jgi:hypothetical protein